MRYLSVCSGIEAATVAWHPLGWTPVAFSEIEPFPAAVLKHHYPNVPNYGDMTKHKEWPLGPGSIDLLVGGTPCQSFSVAGLRKGISDPRGGLMLTYLEIAQRLRPRWIVWENVPGVLSSGGGRDFGSFLGALGELRYGWAYRVLDAQYCRVDGRWPKAVPQRRRRVFVVGCDLERDPRGRERAAEVLALGTGLRWHLAESGKTRKAAPADAEASIARCVTTGEGKRQDYETCTIIPQPVPYDLFQITAPVNRQNRKPGDPCHTLARDNAAHAAVVGTDLYNGAITGDVAATMGTPGSSVNASGPTVMAFKPGQSAEARSLGANVDVACTLEAGGGGNNKQAVAFAQNQVGEVRTSDVSGTINTNSNASGRNTPMAAVAFTPGNLARGAGPSPNAEVAPTQRCSAGRGADDQRTCVAHTMTVRRLTAKECERLQAFPDDYTLIPWRKKPADECPDGPRYKALGNSMAVNCMAWIGERIAAVEARNDR